MKEAHLILVEVLAILVGHTESSSSAHPTDQRAAARQQSVFVDGSEDGEVSLWRTLQSENIDNSNNSRRRKSATVALLLGRLMLMNSADKVGRNIQLALRADNETRTHRRRRRYDYEDVHKWDEDDDSLNYELEEEEEEEEPSLLLKLSRNWRKAGPRVVCLMALLIMFLLVLCGLCRVTCKFYCKTYCKYFSCCGSPYLKEMFQHCYTDPMYEKVKDLGELMGIEITYAMYEKIKDHYVDDSLMSDMTFL